MIGNDQTQSRTILLIDSDQEGACLIERLLAEQGHRVQRTGTGAEAQRLAEELQPDLIVLDLLLPDIDGLILCSNLKSRSAVAILICSRTSRKRDSVLALKLGADDFIAKPFDQYDFTARVEAILRRNARRQTGETAETRQQYKIDELLIDLDRHRATLGSTVLQLTPTEYRLLAVLCSIPEKVFSRDELADLVWGIPEASTGRTIDVHIRRLRSKLQTGDAAPPTIISVRSHGYKIVGKYRSPGGPSQGELVAGQN